MCFSPIFPNANIDWQVIVFLCVNNAIAEFLFMILAFFEFLLDIVIDISRIDFEPCHYFCHCLI